MEIASPVLLQALPETQRSPPAAAQPLQSQRAILTAWAQGPVPQQDADSVWRVDPGWTLNFNPSYSDSCRDQHWEMCFFPWGGSFQAFFEVHLNLEGAKGNIAHLKV